MDKMPFVGDYTTSAGVLSYDYQAKASLYVSQKIDELSTLLTAGRLSRENKQVLVNAHAFFQLVHGIDFADRAMLQLIAAAPEFHTSSLGEIILLYMTFSYFSPLLNRHVFLQCGRRVPFEMSHPQPNHPVVLTRQLSTSTLRVEPIASTYSLRTQTRDSARSTMTTLKHEEDSPTLWIRPPEPESV